MSTNLNRAGILVNFPGIVGGNAPQDVIMFFDDFLGTSYSATAGAAVWQSSLLQAATGIDCIVMSNGDMDEAGGILSMTCEATAYDGENLQVNGSAFQIKAGYPIYFETRVATGDVSDQEFFVGLSAVDVEIVETGPDDCVGFELQAGVLSAQTAINSAEKLTTLTAMVDKVISTPGGFHRLAFFYDGIDTINFYQDSNDDGIFEFVASRTVSTTLDYVPTDISLTPTIEAIGGDTAAADVFYCDYVLCAQPRYRGPA